jgi:hypothetical protein
MKERGKDEKIGVKEENSSLFFKIKNEKKEM